MSKDHKSLGRTPRPIREVAELIHSLLLEMIEEMVFYPEKIEVSHKCHTMSISFEVSSSGEDYGLMIGKNGDHARSLRDIVHAICQKNGYRSNIDFVTPDFENKSNYK